MDYKEKYEIALSRAKNLHKDAIDMGETLRAKQCEIIFPELAESENERIRKTIIRFFKDNYPDETEMYDGTVTVGKAIAWLEEQKSVEEIVERCKDSWYNEGKIQGQIEGLSDEEKYQQGWHDALEKQVHVDKEEDDRIRRHLIKHFGNKTKKDWNGVPVHSILTWLEKQGEPAEINPTEFDTRLQALIGKFDSLPKEELIGSLSFWLNVVHNDGTYKEEKQGEKPINETDEEIVKAVKDTSVLDMVESKLHKGEWIISNNGDCVGQIIDYGGDNFFWCEHTNGYFSGYFKKDYHLWTIQDAKDGDVLVNGSNIFIFHFLNDTRLMGYCHVNTNDGRFYNDIGKNECFCLIDAVVTPATKEQRGLLFSKMKEAGFEWDAEKKELKKVEDEEYNGDDYGIDSLYHAISILEKTLGEVEGYQSDDGILEHKCAITAVKKLYKKKPAEWSEEDERLWHSCIVHIEAELEEIEKDEYGHSEIISDLKESCKECIKWLESLKERLKN